MSTLRVGHITLRHKYRIPEWASALYCRTRNAAEGKGRPFTLSADEYVEMVRACKGKCALSGVAFDHTTTDTRRRNPLAPSIDRIDCSRGYEPGNCRLVCLIVNIALSDWGLDPLLTVAEGLLNTSSPDYREFIEQLAAEARLGLSARETAKAFLALAAGGTP